MAFLLQNPKTDSVQASDTHARSKPAGTRLATPAMMVSTKKGFLRFCCTNMVEPRLVDVRSKSGDDLFFETVWICPTCHRASC
jgi:hypothetical protein